MHQLALAAALKDIPVERAGTKCGQPDFLGRLAPQGFVGGFAEVHMPPYGRVPAPGLYVLPLRAALKVELALRVEDVEMHHGVETFRPVVALAPRGRPDDTALLVDQRQALAGIVMGLGRGVEQEGAVAVAEETESVAEGVVVNAAPVTTDKGRDEQKEGALGSCQSLCT